LQKLGDDRVNRAHNGILRRSVEVDMRLVKVPRADGSVAYVNPQLVRAVVASDKHISLIQFDNDHVLMLREQVDKIAQDIEAAL